MAAALVLAGCCCCCMRTCRWGHSTSWPDLGSMCSSAVAQRPSHGCPGSAASGCNTHRGRAQ
eukprot:364365-Chlamydomonas_euryale.AAC.9